MRCEEGERLFWILARTLLFASPNDENSFGSRVSWVPVDLTAVFMISPFLENNDLVDGISLNCSISTRVSSIS